MVRDRLLVAAGAATISFAPVLVKLAATHGLGPTPIAVWRLVLAGLAMAAFALWRWHRILPPPPVLRWIVVAGVAFAFDLFLWHASILIIGAGMSTILGITQVFWAALVSALLLSERLSPRFLVGVTVAFAGVVLLVGVGSEIDATRHYLLGVVYGLATGVTYAGFILSVRHAGMVWARTLLSAGERPPSSMPAADAPLARAFRLLAVALLIAGLLLVPVALLEGESFMPESSDAYLYLVLLVLGPQLLGWLLISTALPRVRATAGSLILLLQPALAATWGATLFGEKFTWLQLGGALLTLAGVYLGSGGAEPENAADLPSEAD